MMRTQDSSIITSRSLSLERGDRRRQRSGGSDTTLSVLPDLMVRRRSDLVAHSSAAFLACSSAVSRRRRPARPLSMAALRRSRKASRSASFGFATATPFRQLSPCSTWRKLCGTRMRHPRGSDRLSVLGASGFEPLTSTVSRHWSAATRLDDRLVSIRWRPLSSTDIQPNPVSCGTRCGTRCGTIYASNRHRLRVNP